MKTGVGELEQRETSEPEIEKLLSSDKVRLGFAVLANANIRYQENTLLYQALISSSQEADKLAQGFVALMKANLPYQENAELYQQLMNKAYAADRLAEVFAVLSRANIPYQGNAELCLQVIDQVFYADRFSLLFETFDKAKIPYQGNVELYLALITRAEYTDKLEQGFAALDKANVPYQGNADLCMLVLTQAYCANKLVLAFARLEKVNLAFHENAALYMALINNIHEAISLAQGFAALSSANFPYQENTEIYQALINHAGYADELAQAFIVLMKASILYQANIELFQAVISDHSVKLAQGFVTLMKANIPYQGDTQILYKALMNKASKADKLAQGFAELMKVNIPDQEKAILLETAVHDLSNAPKLPEVFRTLNQLGISYQNHPEFFNASFLLTNADLSGYCLDKLYKTGYSFQVHEKFLHPLLMMLSQAQVNYQAVIYIINQACDYAQKNTLQQKQSPGFQQQIQDLTTFVESNSSPDDSLTLGPLNKSEATVKIEELLEQISRIDCENHKLIFFKPPETYILKLPGQNEINLSLLIKNANLSHLTLSNELIARLGDILKKLVESKWENTSENPIVKLLPEAQQVAISIYTTPHYQNINALFRSEPLELSTFCVQDDENMLAYFLIGCLLNDAASKIQVIPWQMPEKDLLEKFAPSTSTILDRGERLTDEIVKRRTANAWTFPALTSFSLLKEGSRYFNQPGTTRTKLQVTQNHFVINKDEEEVIFPQGEQIVTTQGPGYLLSVIKRSPTLDPKNHYFSHLALEHAFVNYLSKEYAEGSSVIDLNGKSIVRPNHGMAHTYRVMLAIDQIINYFAHSAHDQEFKEFCQSLDDTDIEWLRVAAAFSITGRESEISASEHLELYDQYRAASANHFMRFVNETAPQAKNDTIQRMQHIIRYMGNPKYESKDGIPGINNHPDESERQLRDFTHRILTIAHKIDLPRCFSPTEFAQAMRLCRDLSTQSESQQNALAEMIRYNIQLIKAHGNRLCCDIQANGEFAEASLGYKDIFSEASSSLKQLFEITQTVPRPLITLPFQFRAQCGAEASHDAKKRKTLGIN